MAKREYSNSKEVILDAAVRVLIRSGLGGLTTDTVIKESGLSKAGFFYNYHTKDELLEALAKKLIKGWHDLLGAYEAKDPNPVGRGVRAFLDLCVDDLNESDSEAQLLTRAVAELFLLQPDLLNRANEGHLMPFHPSKNGGLDPSQCLAIHLAVDGLWYHSISPYAGFSEAQKKAVIKLLRQRSEGTVLEKAKASSKRSSLKGRKK